jgi:membrane protein YqaA with SNARE-associated domain
MVTALLIRAAKKVPVKRSASLVRHLGASGLFFLAILDSTPLPTFGGPDILTAILAARHRNPWYEFAAVATVGSVIGAYLTFRLARRAGTAYLESKFGDGKLPGLLRLFHRWGTAVLAASAAVPFPTPTSAFFAAAGASRYSTRRFVVVVALSRAARYSLIAFLADRYGRHFLKVIRHPGQYWGWLLLIAVLIAGVTVAAILINKKLKAARNGPGVSPVPTTAPPPVSAAEVSYDS